MTLTNLMTVLKTVAMASVKLTVPADRIGLGCGSGQAYPADSLSPGRFPTPHNPEPEQLWSRQGQSTTQMRKQMRTDTPDAVPPASLAGCLSPGSSADRVAWRVAATDPSRNRVSPVCVVRTRLGSDCHSLARFNDIKALPRETMPAAIAGK
jgi:hypothetical protein